MSMNIIGHHYARVLLRTEAESIQQTTPESRVASYADVYDATMTHPWYATLSGQTMTIHGAITTFTVQLKSGKGA